jgi:hypothetical protein
MLYGGMSECERQNYHMVMELIDTDSTRRSRNWRARSDPCAPME